MRTHTLLSALLAVSILPVTWAQEVAPQTPAAGPQNADVVIGEPAAASTATRDRDTLSVDFPDEDIRNILRNVADLFELNLVVPDTLQGRTSIKLRDVTWRQIFQVVLSPVGYTFVEEGNIIKVVSQDQLLAEPVATEVFLINYARAGDILGSVNPLVDPAVGGRIVVDARSNALVITERPSRMSNIRAIIEQLDKATAQVMIESKFVEVTDRDVKNIGVNWASLENFRLGVGDIERNWDRNRGQTRTSSSTSTDGSNNNTNNSNNQSTLSGTTTSSTTGTTSGTTTTNTGGTSTSESETTDDGLVAPVTTSTTSTTGPTSLTTSTGGNTADTSDNVTNTITNTLAAGFTNTTTAAINQLMGLTNVAGTNRADTAVFSASEFNIIISALQSQNEVKLVSNPTVVTLNNTEATINIGERFPIPNYSYNEEQGRFEVSGFTYEAIGINLRVTPQVNPQGFIKLSVQPEVSSRAGVSNFQGAEIPIIASRRTSTQISLQDGYTMGIGGLIENTTGNGQTKVPVLGNIPGIGRLFRSDSRNMNSRNLLIFITAKTISPEGGTIEEVFDPRAIRAMNLKRDDLPGYRDGSDPFGPAPQVETLNP